MTETPPIYQPLYPPEGAPVSGFKCGVGVCKAVTRTEKGIRMHLAVCHAIRFQAELFNDEPDPSAAGDLPKAARA